MVDINYFPRDKIQKKLDSLGVKQVQINEEYERVQWHKADFTLVAEASLYTVGKYTDDTKKFKRWGGRGVIEDVKQEEVPALALKLAEEDVKVDFIIKKGRWYYAVVNFKKRKAEKTFEEEVIAVRKLFIECMVGIEDGKQGTKDHMKKVAEFNAGLNALLDKYTDQSVGTFAQYVAQLGIPHGTAFADIVRLRGMYND